MITLRTAKQEMIKYLYEAYAVYTDSAPISAYSRLYKKVSKLEVKIGVTFSDLAIPLSSFLPLRLSLYVLEFSRAYTQHSRRCFPCCSQAHVL